MCGFTCIINHSNHHEFSLSKIKEYSKINLHRGPDRSDLYYDQDFCAIFKRLSIIDLTKNSDQPLVSEDKRFVIVFNGEIYNFKELKLSLKEKGYKFKSNGDAEVLLKSFIYWGDKFINKLRGMFAFCIWDKKLKKMIAYRDHFGQKPMYFKKLNNTLIISSEIKDIIYFTGDKKEDSNTSNKYLFKSFADIKNKTFFKDIHRLEPSSKLEYVKDNLKISKYWKLKYSEEKNFDKEEFKKAFFDSVKMHTNADVKIAYLLSGGIDSTSVISAARQFSRKINTFSIIPKKTFNEKPYINDFVKKLGLNHQYIDLNHRIKSFDINEMLKFQDEPVRASNCIYQFLLREKIEKKNFKVLIGGEGGDEIMGGYSRMLNIYLYHLYRNKNFQELNKHIKNFNLSKNKLNLSFKSIKNIINKKNSDLEDTKPLDYIDNKKIQSKKFLKENWNDITNLKNKNLFKTSLINSIFSNDLSLALRMEDRNSMAFGIENRVPMLDIKFVEYIFKIKTKYFINSGHQKYMIRKSLEKISPKKVLYRKIKSGRPGNDNYYIFEIVFNEFIDLIQKYKNSDIPINFKVLESNIVKQKKNRKYQTNGYFYFRIYNYLKWRNLNFN